MIKSVKWFPPLSNHLKIPNPPGKSWVVGTNSYLLAKATKLLESYHVCSYWNFQGWSHTEGFLATSVAEGCCVRIIIPSIEKSILLIIGFVQGLQRKQLFCDIFCEDPF